MKIADIYRWFEAPPRRHLNKEQAVCFVCAVLQSQQVTYGTELLALIEQTDHYTLSDTVLNSVLLFLEKQKMIDSFRQKCPGRGRPRRMIKLKPDSVPQAQSLAALWLNFTAPKIANV